MKKLFLLFALMLFATTSFAGTAYYFDPSDTGSLGNGTYAEPFNDEDQITAASLSTGDDLYFKVGTHHYLGTSKSISIYWCGSDTDQTIIGAYYGENQFGLNGNDRPIIDGGGINATSGIVFAYPVSESQEGYITIKDLKLINAKGYGVFILGYAGGIGVGKNHRAVGCEISNMWVEDTGLANAYFFKHVSESLIENNVAANCPNPWRMGTTIDLLGSQDELYPDVTRDNTVRGNILYGSGSEGINTRWGAKYNTIEDNIIYNFGNVAIYMDSSQYNTIRDNLIWQTPTGYGAPTRGIGIMVDNENDGGATGKAQESTGNMIYRNRVAGAKYGIMLNNLGESSGLYLKDTEVYENRLVDNEYNFGFRNNVAGWSGNLIYDNYSFIFTSAHEHTGTDSPLGVTWATNHYNTDIDTPAGNAATSYTLDDPDLLITSGWWALDTSVEWADFTMDPEPSDPATGASINSSNAYGGATHTPILLYIFEEGTGTTVDDLVASNDATLTNPTWTSLGVTVDAIGSIITAPMPAFGDDHSIFMAYTSTAATAPQYGKFYYYPQAVRDFNLEREDADTTFRWDTGSTSFYPTVPDTFDQYFHSLVVTSDDSGNSRCIYIDGSLAECDDTAFANPSFSDVLYLLAKHDGTRQLNATIHIFAAYNSLLNGTDAASLHADYDQMITDAPSRSFNIYTPPVGDYGGAVLAGGQGGFGGGGQGRIQ